MFVDFFIRRPVFASVCALLIVLAGAVVIPGLPISLYPDLAPPQVTVSSVYIGANSQTVEHDVTTPLEESINGVEGMRYITSSSSNDGSSTITITFQTGYDINIAAVDVQNRVSSAQGLLPQAVKNTGVTITKSNPNFVFAAGFYSDNNRYSQDFISNYIDLYVKDPLERISGVGAAQIFGVRKYAMRLWLDPTKLAARQLTATDVISALQEQNVEIAAGNVGQQPMSPPQDFQYSVRAVGRLTTPEQFNNIVLKNGPTGIIQLRDVGRAELGAEDYGTNLNFSGATAVGIGVQQLSTANALDVDRKGKAALLELSKSFPPGLHYTVAFDTTTVIGDSIHEVVITLAEAIVIVIAVIFLFLLDWRATIIPAITIPVSLIGTFAFIKIFGFSINSLTLFGITLATGLVVDDAIVVIENVQRHLSEADPNNPDHDPHKATSVAMAEVTSAVIATSLVLISVFVPVSFFPGTTGILYKQFSLTIAFAIAISAFNALTLSPALAALFLRGEEDKYKLLDWTHIEFLKRAYRGFVHLVDNSLTTLSSAYGRAIHFILRIRWVMMLLFVAGLAATGYMYQHVPTAFVPGEDQGYFILQVLAPQGASLSYTTHLADQAQAILAQDKDILGTFSVMGFGFSGTSPNQGLIFVPLQPQDQRLAKGHADTDIIERVSPKLLGIPGGIVVAFPPPAIQGLGNFGGFQFELQDLGRNTLQDIDRIAHQIAAAGNDPKSGLTGMFTSFTSNDPQLLVNIDREKAKTIGVPFSQISDALSVYMGSEYVNDFEFNNRSYRVYVQADAPFRRTSKDIRQFYVRTNSGQMVPLDDLVTIDESSGPQTISHYNLFRSAEILGSAAPGKSSSEGLAAMEAVAKKNMLQGMSFEWSGLALEEIESSGKAIVIFALGLLVVYLALSAQYESFALPFIILLAVPMAVLGALSFVAWRGLVDDVYVQIGLVMLIGLSAKNSILIVEFAEQIRERGLSIAEAAIQAGELRLRPILMTSSAFILGVLPLVFATGAGKLGRHSVGTAIVGGMILSTVLNLFFIPVLYVLLKSFLERFSKPSKKVVEA
ncbi:efflux RND transporter permease subunit [Granulicella mallensis]|uniref:Transporter, hydrophobe/amphiphile efflux-1 (HAE1) family n=1 Tax=Granulicella mallensis (strain ATCC BAA-1857 / DSM 23137 / MP5ACTX8) TaxID=682795 RepID=G8NP61_GRAMM|nr:efflux RND transporter permease subunit [Granulicella mallensis]AEU38260.1 transporter, hydrophobe/amphiphile efflux-1 (HAE1) family [Granulicella mallensis MP5ACTX8]